MFHREHTGGKRFGCVFRQDGHPGLAEDGACVEVGGDFMDGATCFAVFVGESAGVGVQSRILWQKRGVDVEHPALEPLDEARGQDAHEARKAKDVGLCGVDVSGEVRLESLPRRIGAVVDGGGGDAEDGCFRKAPGGGIIGGDKGGAGGMVAHHVADQSQHIRATPGNQDGDALHSRRPR